MSLTRVPAHMVSFTPDGVGAVARKASEKLSEVVSVKDFGAIGDGIADDTAAIQAAIDAVSTDGGGVLFLPIGVYKLTSTITLKPGVSIIGEQKGEFGNSGAPGVRLRKAFATGNVLFSPSSQELAALTFENFCIEGNKGGIGGSNGSGVVIEKGHDLIFRRVWADRLPSSGFVIGQGATSFHNYFYNCYAFFCGGVGYAVQSDWMRFIDCWADGNYIGIEFPNSSQCGAFAHIERCHFEEFELAAIALRGNPAVGTNGNNIIRDCVMFSRPYFDAWPAHGIFIETTNGAGASGNLISGNFITYQSTYGPAKAGHYGIFFTSGGASGSNIIENNIIGAFDYGVYVTPGSVRNILKGNRIDGCNLGMANTAVLNTVDGNIFTNNTTDYYETSGAASVVNGNYFSVTPALDQTTIATGNRSAFGVAPASGIKFQANQVSSSDPNVLDDYEEGTWTATPTGFTDVGGATTWSGTYTKIGRLVHVIAVGVPVTSVENPGGAYLSGLPFEPVSRSVSSWSNDNSANIGCAPIITGQTILRAPTFTATGFQVYASATYIAAT